MHVQTQFELVKTKTIFGKKQKGIVKTTGWQRVY